MSDIETRYHEKWLGLVQPSEGLVVSVPVLVDAESMNRQGPELTERFLGLVDKDGRFELRRLAEALLQLPRELIDDAPEAAVHLAEGQETVRPTFAVKDREGRPYVLAWEVPGVDLDKPDTRAGAWAYPPIAKMERLLRSAGVSIGWLSNRTEVRLVYAPAQESSGWLSFRSSAMSTSSGREVLEALVMLCGATRLVGSAPERRLDALLRASRLRQANVTGALAEQVFHALEILLAGFEQAAARDGDSALRAAVEDGSLYAALLTVLLRLVFVLYAEDRGLLPIDQALYEKHLGLLSLFEKLRDDAAMHPDTMSRRFGAWSRLVSLFRAVFFGAHHGALHLPARRGELFDPSEHPILEGWGPAGGAPVAEGDRELVRAPTVDDGTVLAVLEKLLLLDGQRLSYRALDVEQIGSVYEALMGYEVLRLEGDAVCLRGSGVWLTADEVLREKRRGAYLDELGTKVGKSGAAIDAAKTPADMLAALRPLATRHREAKAGTLVLQPGKERRRTSSHYTPRSLTEPIVEKTLRPLLRAMGDAPTAEHLLALKVCDPAVGSGAFLVAACRFLADELVKAWMRAGVAVTGDATMHARRLVAQRCLYGVDKNRFAVSLAKLSLWLVTLAKDEPFTFLDHALRHGDSLVGLNLEQIAAFDWDASGTKQLDLLSREIETELGEAVARRQEIVDAAETTLSTEEKERLAFYAKDGLDRVQLLGDLIVGAFFAFEKDKDRKKELLRRRDLVTGWLLGGGRVPEELRAMQAEIRGKLPVFHWAVEFPEVFFAERPDPLEGDRVNRVAMMDAFVGNPPFAGKNQIVDTSGTAYVFWLLATVQGSHGNADLSAFFFRRASELLGRHGTFGLIATNSIAQGDTRATGLQHLVSEEGCAIYSAMKSKPWPGSANVAVSVVHVAKGVVATSETVCELDGLHVPSVNSRLLAAPERVDPIALSANKSLRENGCKVYGEGFLLSPAERDALIGADARNRSRIFPFLGGEEVNTYPTQAFERYVVNFGQLPLEAAREWPDLFELVERRVKPERDRAKESTADGAHRKKYWWQFAQPRPELFQMIRPLAQCLVTARVTKHLCFSFQPTERIFSEQLFVFAFDDYAHFAVLQSRIHEPWARLLSSSLEDRLRYSASDCFDTFPFPASFPPELEAAGRAFYEARAAYMVRENVGLTVTYNRLKDRDVDDAEVRELRRLHEAMDRAVLAAYGWGELALAVPPFEAAVGDAGRRGFEDEVIDRLFALNAVRAEGERLATVAAEKPAKAKGVRKKKGPAGQGDLGVG